ncbi:UNVERIFIED_CONTAM: DNA-binding response OmpR family regulator [Acetivibrio alkalicellulosi]
MNGKILIVEDNESTIEFLSIYLKNEGYVICASSNGESALNVVRNEVFDLILLDVMMPKIDGFEFLKKFREFSSTPIILLTAKDQQQDKIKGFISGCDDYITKPFDLTELSLRISAILKRTLDSQVNCNNIIYVKDLVIDLSNHTLSKNNNQEIKVTPKEFSILVLLAKNVGRVFSSKDIYELIWQEPFFETDNCVLTHIRNLRDKLADSAKNSKYIKTVWGVGYKIDK